MGICWIQIFHENTIQIIAFIVFNGAVCAYSLFQYSQLVDVISNVSYGVQVSLTQSQLQPIIILIIAVACASEVVFLFLGVRLYLEFGWKIYKKIGADPAMKSL